MIIPDERALKNLSESPNVCISKLFLHPKKKQFYLKKMHVSRAYFPMPNKTTEHTYLLFRVFYKYKLACISYSMHI